MKMRTRLLIAFLALLSISCDKDEPAPIPSITGFKPQMVPIGGAVTISGFNFSTKPVDNMIKVNGKVQFATSATATSLVIEILPGTTSGPITVTVGGQTATSTKDLVIACLLWTYQRNTSSSSQTFNYWYDTDYRLVSVDATGTSGSYYTDYVYDTNGFLISRTHTESGVSTLTSYAYDSEDRMLSSTSNGVTTTYSYNATGQLVMITYSPTASTTFEYPNTTTHNFSKEVYTSTSTTATYLYEYDSNPNPFKVIFPHFPTQTDNNLIKSTVGAVVSNFALTYNAYGFPSTVTGSGASTLTGTLSYDCD